MLQKTSIYIAVILLYLSLAKSFTPTVKDILYIPTKEALSSSFGGKPLTVMLVNHFTTGVMAKTYYLQLKIIHSFHTPTEVLARTTKKFYNSNINNIGLSIFRRFSKKQKNVRISFATPGMPGTVFLGNPSYGQFRMDQSGERVWRFYRAYRSIPKFLGWDSYRPSKNDYKKSVSYINSEQIFLGPRREFGINGYITKKIYSSVINNIKESEINWKNYIINKYLKLPKGHLK